MVQVPVRLNFIIAFFKSMSLVTIRTDYNQVQDRKHFPWPPLKSLNVLCLMLILLHMFALDFVLGWYLGSNQFHGHSFCKFLLLLVLFIFFFLNGIFFSLYHPSQCPLFKVLWKKIYSSYMLKRCYNNSLSQSQSVD